MSELPPPLAEIQRQKCVCFCGVSLLSPRSISDGSSVEHPEEKLKCNLHQFVRWVTDEIRYVETELNGLETSAKPDDEAEALILEELYKGLQIRLQNLQLKFQKVSELLMMF
jgi:hypothetical protein